MDILRDLIKQLASNLTTKNLQITTAESCTGGLIAAYFTETVGSSHWFERGFVTYSNHSKQQMLGVNPALITECGAVSEAVARAMAKGALKHSEADIALAVTGIAGPDGGSIEKPVGMVCFGWAAHGLPTESRCQYYTGSRENIRLLACKQAIEGVLSLYRKNLFAA